MGNFEVHNIMEDLVEEKLDEYISKAGACSCELCRTDIEAFALNKLPARYVVHRQGNLMARIDAMRQQASTDVVAAVMEAVSVIGSKPNHVK